MSRLATSFVLGYHGCDRSVGNAAVLQQTALMPSAARYDWLGAGIYFWEADPIRALEWAKWKRDRGDYADPFVIGAVIDLGNCLDLVVRENLELLADAYVSLGREVEAAGMETMPVNKSAKDDQFDDRGLRYLDYAVIEQVHASVDLARSNGVTTFEPFDTVRGMFTEGDLAYPNAGFKLKTHTQIAVRNVSAIKGIFIP